MGKKYQKTVLDTARDEMFSHIQRCDVLDAGKEEQLAWLDDTMEYMRERYPELLPNEWAELEEMTQRYLKPAVPHGRDATAQNREEWQETTVA